MFDILFQKYVTFKNLIFFVITILFVILICKNIDIALLFFASFVIACSLNPAVDKLMQVSKLKRSTASVLVLSFAILLFLFLLVPTIFLATSEVSSFAVKFPKYVDELDEFITNSHLLAQMGVHGIDGDALASGLSASSADILQNLVDIGKNVSSAVVYLVISFMVIFYFMSDEAVIRKTFLRMFPSEMRKNAGNILDIISQKIGGYITALVVTVMSVGIIMVLGLFILKVPYALLLGLITAVFDVIPVIGPAIALIICIVTTYQVGMGAVLSVIAVFAVAQLVENNFVRPYVFGKMLNIHPLLIYLFLFFAAKYMGITGVIFAPAVAATVCVLIEELYMKKIE